MFVTAVGKLVAYDTDGDGDFDVEDAKVLLGKLIYLSFTTNVTIGILQKEKQMKFVPTDKHLKNSLCINCNKMHSFPQSGVW